MCLSAVTFDTRPTERAFYVMLRAAKTSDSPQDRYTTAIQRVREIFASREGKDVLRFVSERETDI